MVTAAERQFAVYRRGEVRELGLAFYREGLRELVDPETGEPFTEETIQLVTQPGSRFYLEADAIDLVLQGQQKRAEFLAQQARIDRAGRSYLLDYHGNLWNEQPLPGSGGSGDVVALGNPGTTWLGSTTVPDPLATQATDSAGNRYQVLVTGQANANGQATLAVVAITLGEATNLDAGAALTWSNPPSGSDPTATVGPLGLNGGLPPETNDQFADRLEARVRHKPAAGNAPQFRAWARAASVAVQDAYVYPCAFAAGSVLVVPVQRRGDTVGPLARIPNAAVLAQVTGAVVPPGSPNVPPHVFVVVVAPVSNPTDITLQLSQLKGSQTGWTDLQPFPQVNTGGTNVTVTTVNSTTSFEITAASAGQLPQGAAGPLGGVNLMQWDPAESRFKSLDVDTVTDDGGGVYTVELNEGADPPIAVGTVICPDMALRDTLATGVETYFDSLGPGEVIDLDTNPLAQRAFRFPKPTEEAPNRAGQVIVSVIVEALGAAAADALLSSITVSTPSLPSDTIDGPGLITVNEAGVYSLD